MASGEGENSGLPTSPEVPQPSDAAVPPPDPLVDTDPGAGAESVPPTNAPTQLLPTVSRDGEAPSVRAVARRVASALPALGRDGGQPEVPHSARATVDRRRRAAQAEGGPARSAAPTPPRPAAAPPPAVAPPPAPGPSVPAAPQLAAAPPAPIPAAAAPGGPRHAAPESQPSPEQPPSKANFVDLKITTAGAVEAAPAAVPEAPAVPSAVPMQRPPPVGEPTPDRPVAPAARLVEPVMVSPRPDLMGQPPVEAGRRAVVDAEVVPPSGPGMVGAVAAEMVSALTEVAFREATADEWIVAEPALRDAVPGLPEPVHSGPRVLVADSWDTAPQPMVQQDSYSGRRRAVAVNTRLWLVIGLVVAALSAAVAVPWMLTTDVVPAAQTTPEAAVPADSDEPDPTEISATASAEPSPSTSAPMPAVGASPLVTESPSPAVPSFNLTVQAEKGGSSTAWGGTAVTTSFAGATVVDKLGEKWLTSTIDGWLEFRNINAPAAGAYSLKIYYVYTSASPSDTDRRIQVSVNGTNISPVQTFTPSSSVKSRTLSVTLRSGNNTIRLTNDNYQCPAIDKIEISRG